MSNQDDAFERAAAALRSAKLAIAVTGAGISVESGIPSFRGESGIWKRYPPEEYASIDAYVGDPVKVWQLWRELAKETADCAPNPGHRALAALEQRGILKTVMTQNIDNLHQEGGSRNVIEYHGNARHLRCLDCGAGMPLDRDEIGELPPRCPTCRGLMKPDIIMFGELIPQDALMETDRLAHTCDVVIVVGTSAQVFPAAAIPHTAKQPGAFITEANIEHTDFTHTITDAFLDGPAGETLPRLAEMV
ncbi:MAG: NAD-dependent deacylase [bacterium]|nr:NAD-dependent deacylase [bacterium]